MLGTAYAYVRDLVANGGDIMFVGTKKQAQEAIEQEARRAQMPFVNRRWLGGMLTNFQTIQRRVDYLVRLENRQAKGELQFLPKKEALRIEDEIARLNRSLGGIKELTRLPNALFIIDPAKERNAVMEARRLGIPIVAPVDTNCNPLEIDYPIPANDDAIRAVKLLCSKIADACVEGLNERETRAAEEQDAEADNTVLAGDFSYSPFDEDPAAAANAAEAGGEGEAAAVEATPVAAAASAEPAKAQ
jgi:small subunit ribosomal protein S2